MARSHPKVGALALLALAVVPACREAAGDGAITASGHVEATEVRLSTKVAGTIEALGVEEGDRVAAGQEIARLDTTDTRLALAGALAQRDQAAADLRLGLAGSRVEDVAEAAAQVQRAEADLDGAQKDLDRMEGLLASGSGTTKSRDEARTRRDVATSNLRAARERLGKLEAGTRPEEIAASRARLAVAEARVASVEQQLKDATITSSVSGIVTQRLAEKGELASPGMAMAVVTDLDTPWVNVYVAETDLGRIRVGQEAEVLTDDGQTRKGRVTYVSSKAEFTPKNVQTRDERVKLVYRVKIGLQNQDGLFKPGMPAQARLRPADAAR